MNNRESSNTGRLSVNFYRKESFKSWKCGHNEIRW